MRSVKTKDKAVKSICSSNHKELILLTFEKPIQKKRNGKWAQNMTRQIKWLEKQIKAGLRCLLKKISTLATIKV